MAQHKDLVRLRHMRDYAQEAIKMAGNRSLQDLQNDRMFQLALARLVEIIGEAASKVSSETRVLFPGIPWQAITGMRNRMIHGYDQIHLNILWDTVEMDIQPLLEELEDAIDRVERTS